MPRRKKTEDPIKTLTGELIHAQKFLPLDESDPVAYLELRRLEYVKRIEGIADHANLMASSEGRDAKAWHELELKALAFATRLTSVWKSRVDVSMATNLGLVRPPNLKDLSEEELKKLEAGEPLAGDEDLN